MKVSKFEIEIGANIFTFYYDNLRHLQAGFFLVQYAHLWQQHLDNLVHLFSVGKLKVAIDLKIFVGVQSVVDAVEYLHSGKSVGKVVVCIDPSFSQQTAKLRIAVNNRLIRIISNAQSSFF
ncbi:ARP protein (REF) [Artemisia annua]|uniref:ARP protein (REF) n=1 Tax=Artemisia annua TaxID=35608 RepID=A0A2U1LYC1_ARTAN|nr:ARP protein (REF) [Artemisia annua]